MHKSGRWFEASDVIPMFPTFVWRADLKLETYKPLNESILVDAPVDKVWARVGEFCNITEWMNSPEWEDCKYLQGDGGPGTVRSIVNEVLVGQTQYSYTYAQPPRKDTLYNLARYARCRSSDSHHHAADLYDAAG